MAIFNNNVNNDDNNYTNLWPVSLLNIIKSLIEKSSFVFIPVVTEIFRARNTYTHLRIELSEKG